MATTYTINPLNDFYLQVKLSTVNTSTQAVTPLTTGTVTAFLATSDASTATAADASLTTTCTYSTTTGKWLVAFEGSVLTSALMASLFGSVAPWVIVTANTNDVRVAIQCAYADYRLATQN